MYADLGPGQTIELDPPSLNGVDLGFSHKYVFERSRNGRGDERRETARSEVNLYEYVNGMPLTQTDPSGMEALSTPAVSVIAVGAAFWCLSPHLAAAWHFYEHDEEMRHCYASCTAAKACTSAISFLGGLGFEAATSALRGFTDAETANALYDIANNIEGLKCAGIMGVYGYMLPTVCVAQELANPLLGTGCAGCCERKVGKKK